ncbi:hypothetical protein ACFS07_10730 [Undibacterium arcticum]
MYDQKFIATYLHEKFDKSPTRETINRWLNGKGNPEFSHAEYLHLECLFASTTRQFSTRI